MNVTMLHAHEEPSTPACSVSWPCALGALPITIVDSIPNEGSCCVTVISSSKFIAITETVTESLHASGVCRLLFPCVLYRKVK